MREVAVNNNWFSRGAMSGLEDRRDGYVLMNMCKIFDKFY